MSTASTETAEPIIGEPLLSLYGVARELRCDHRTVKRMIDKRTFPAGDVEIAGRPRWRRSSIVRWVAEQGQRATV